MLTFTCLSLHTFHLSVSVYLDYVKSLYYPGRFPPQYLFQWLSKKKGIWRFSPKQKCNRLNSQNYLDLCLSGYVSVCVIYLFLLSEIKRVESGDKYRSVAKIELHHEKPSSNSVKVRIPAKEFPKVSGISHYQVTASLGEV